MSLASSSSSTGTSPPAAAACAPVPTANASPSSPSPPLPLCKHWARSKICLYHEKGKCRFDHPPDYVLPPPVLPRQRGRARGGGTSRRQTDLADRHRSAGGRLQTRNDARVAILRAFLAEELARHGLGDLSAFSVLDVAGGKGELAFQLLNLNNVERCHVIDPRPLSLGKFRKRLEKGFYHRSQGILQHDVVRPRSEPERPVEQLRCLFSSELWEEEEGGDDDRAGGQAKEYEEPGDRGSAGGTGERDDTGNNYDKQREKFFANCHKARGWTWPPVGSANEHAGCDDRYEDDRDDEEEDDEHPRNATADDGDNDDGTDSAPRPSESDDDGVDGIGLAFDHAANVVRTADLIVGMHPDQAVDAIVDAALYRNISFFVVPCCVFRREFPHRRVRVVRRAVADDDDGERETFKRVTRYEELVDYLQAKSPDIRRHVLPFEGRNICLYRVVAPRPGADLSPRPRNPATGAS